MDHAEVWNLEDNLKLPFTDQKEFYPPNYQQHHSFSGEGQFESSFGSSFTSYDECYTPSSGKSFGISDLNGLSSSRTSLGSIGSNSPVDESIFYPVNSMGDLVKKEANEKSQLYMNQCHKSIQDHDIMSYDYSQVNDMYGLLQLQDDLDGLQGMIFDDYSSLTFHDTGLPLPMTSPSNNFVIPSQTFISEPYRPATPMNKPRTVLGSPLEECSQSGEIKYFMSPTPSESYSQRANSSLSSGSRSTLKRTPSIQTLKSSAALHQIQSIGSSRISKKPKRSQQFGSRIGRVAAGSFHCDYAGCNYKSGFQRREHLKRHQKTHGAQKLLHCSFCEKSFQLDRSDNYRAHVRRHSEIKKGSRTKYFPEAIDEVNSWGKKDKAEGKLAVPGKMYRAYSRRVRADGVFRSKP